MKIPIKILLVFLFVALPISIFSQDKSLKKGKVNAKNYYEEISFQFDKNKIIIPVDIEGKTYRFLLDTGAPNIISKEVYEVIKPKHISSIVTNDANKIVQSLDIVSLESLKIGEIEFQDFTTLVYDLNGSDIFKCFGIDGFIGSNMLRHSIIQIDSDAKKLVITDDIKQLGLDKKTSEKIKLVGNQSSPYVLIQLKGQEVGKEMVLIDTGMGGLYDLSKQNYDIFKTKNIFNEIGTSDGASSLSLFGEVPINNQTRVHLPELSINGFKIHDAVTHTTKGNHSKVGAELLNYGMMTIDYKHKRFYFNPRTESPYLGESFGFTQTMKENKLVIGYVWDEELKTKIKYGDIILEVNGQEISDSKFCNYVTKESVLKTLKSLTLKVKTSDTVITDIQIHKKAITEVLSDFNVETKH
jgi:predicted aspartyl protease